MKEINVHEFKKVLEQTAHDDSIDFINVCTRGEYEEKHIMGVRSIPLDELGKHLNEFSKKKTIYIHCQSGHRGERAVEDLIRLGVTAELVNVTGGIMAWIKEGFPTESSTKRIPIMRQVLLTAGFFVTVGVVLSLTVNPHFIYLSLFVGCGLMFAGITGWCTLSYILERMPWNT